MDIQSSFSGSFRFTEICCLVSNLQVETQKRKVQHPKLVSPKTSSFFVPWCEDYLLKRWIRNSCLSIESLFLVRYLQIVKLLLCCIKIQPYYRGFRRTFHTEIDNLKSILKRSSYSSVFIDLCIALFLDNL